MKTLLCVFVAAFDAVTDVCQILKDECRTSRYCSSDLRSDVVIAPFAKPRPLLLSCTEATFGRFGAFALERSLCLCVLPIDAVPSGIAEEASCRKHGWVHNATVATDDRSSGRNYIGHFFRKCKQEFPTAIIALTNETAVSIPAGIAIDVPVSDKWYFDPFSERRQRHALQSRSQ